MKFHFNYSILVLLALTVFFDFAGTEPAYGIDSPGNCPVNLMLLLRFDELSGPVNDAPVFTSTPILSAQTNSAYLRKTAVEDPDEGDVLTHTAPNKPDWLKFIVSSNRAVLVRVPSVSDIGSCSVILNASDGHENVLQGFNIQVSDPLVFDDINNSIRNIVCPNPARDKIAFKIAPWGRTRVEIYDIIGNLHKAMVSENTDLIEIDISDLPVGLYLIKANHQGEISIGKIMKN